MVASEKCSRFPRAGVYLNVINDIKTHINSRITYSPLTILIYNTLNFKNHLITSGLILIGSKKLIFQASSEKTNLLQVFISCNVVCL